MSLRASILCHALPLIPTHSFTRRALVAGYLSLSSQPSTSSTSPSSFLPPSSSTSASTPGLSNLATSQEFQAEAVVDEVLGQGRAAVHALVEAWEDAGRGTMLKGSVEDALTKRLEYSAELDNTVLLEAHALLSTPSSTLNLPIPSRLLSLASSLPLPFPISLPSSSSETSSTTVPGVSPLGPLAYAWRVADHGIRLDPTARGMGVMGEQRGAGAEWYVSRLGLALVYLASEAYLLQPSPSAPLPADPSTPSPPSGPSPNPHLPSARAALAANMSRYDEVRDTLRSAGLSDGIAPVIGFAEFVTRSWAGLIRSRGF